MQEFSRRKPTFRALSRELVHRVPALADLATGQVTCRPSKAVGAVVPGQAFAEVGEHTVVEAGIVRFQGRGV
ncbi:hypothetical protein [Embleya sp. NPDC050493]|uniref:hypothetical protein n=1 Tax=Embleya sp. NPDC050493 TaxID=3363989 RepID=UPI003792105F